MSSSLTDLDISEITILLSPERLATFLKLTGSNRNAIELHQETLRLNSSLMTVIASVEIALRNCVCENLTAYFGNTSWITKPTAPFQWRKMENRLVAKALQSARRAEYSKLSQAQKAELDNSAFPKGRPANLSHTARSIARTQQIQVSDGKIIAETTLYFWKRLYSADYEHSLWRTTLKKTFPNKKLTRADIANNLEAIYQARNRLAHHEPVLHSRLNETLQAVSFISENLGVNQPSKEAPLARLVAPDLAIVKEKAEALHKRFAAYRVDNQSSL